MENDSMTEEEQKAALEELYGQYDYFYDRDRFEYEAPQYQLEPEAR